MRFRQIWFEKENGEFHGFYRVNWENGLVAQRGIIVDGNREGIWIYWNKGGEIELKSGSPWWDNVPDQNRT